MQLCQCQPVLHRFLQFLGGCTGMDIAAARDMRRSVTGPDPLLLLILTSIGLGPGGACGGESRSNATPQEPSESTGGVESAVSGGAPSPTLGGATSGGATSRGGTTTGGAASGGATGGARIDASGGTLISGAIGTTGGAVVAGAAPMTEGVIGCSNPSYPFGEESGLVACDGSFFHRAEAGKCPQTPLRPGEPSGSSAPACATDADCAHLMNGRCLMELASTGPRCESSCETDEDCEVGFVCSCGTVANLCVPSNCRTDADCGEDLLCTAYRELRGCLTSRGFACQVASDQCTSSCPPDQRCQVIGSGDQITRACVTQGAGGACGRPFLVSGSERLARPMLRDDWCERVVSAAPELTCGERAALAAYWKAAALMEHASIAAFARFTLELLALGAPARLVEESCAAMSDEHRHATMCFSLASAFAGESIGPGSLRMDGCLARVDLTDVAVTTFLEGCIGETLAAVEARELALGAEEPVLRSTLGDIAEDEARHSLLAWRFLDWALERGGPTLTAQVEDALRAALARATEPPAGDTGLTPERAAALGLPSSAFRTTLRYRVLDEIVRPALKALLDASDGSLGGSHRVRRGLGDVGALVQ
jgi:hypothetical protein